MSGPTSDNLRKVVHEFHLLAQKPIAPATVQDGRRWAPTEGLKHERLDDAPNAGKQYLGAARANEKTRTQLHGFDGLQRSLGAALAAAAFVALWLHVQNILDTELRSGAVVKEYLTTAAEQSSDPKPRRHKKMATNHSEASNDRGLLGEPRAFVVVLSLRPLWRWCKSRYNQRPYGIKIQSLGLDWNRTVCCGTPQRAFPTKAQP